MVDTVSCFFMICTLLVMRVIMTMMRKWLREEIAADGEQLEVPT